MSVGGRAKSGQGLNVASRLVSRRLRPRVLTRRLAGRERVGDRHRQAGESKRRDCALPATPRQAGPVSVNQSRRLGTILSFSLRRICSVETGDIGELRNGTLSLAIQSNGRSLKVVLCSALAGTLARASSTCDWLHHGNLQARCALGRPGRQWGCSPDDAPF